MRVRCRQRLSFVSRARKPAFHALVRLFVLASAMAAFTPPSRAEVKEIRIALQFGLFNLPVTVAQAQGYFGAQARKAGLGELTVTVARFTGGSAMNDALLSGSTD